MKPQKPQDYHRAELPAEPSAVPGCAECLSLGASRAGAGIRGRRRSG